LTKIHNFWQKTIRFLKNLFLLKIINNLKNINKISKSQEESVVEMKPYTNFYYENLTKQEYLNRKHFPSEIPEN